MKFPNLFLAGAPKCGTTSLADYLGQHSEIFAPLVKEPIFFASDLNAAGPRRSEKDYLALFDTWRKEQYALDASTHYFYSHQAASEIAAASPEARVIIMVRNPVEAAYSMFNQLRFNGAETLRDFSASFEAEARRAERMAPPKFGFAENFLYSRIYNFTENIRRFEHAFGSSQIQVILLDDLKHDPAGTMKALCKFLAIDVAEVEHFNFEVKNTASRARFRWLNTLSVYPPPWIGYFSKPLLSRENRVKLRNYLGASNTITEEYPPLDEKDRQMLVAHFQPEIDRLSAYLGRDLDHWS